MQITRQSPVTGEVNTMDLPVTEAQMRSWQNGAYIQDAMPNLDADQREFIMTGMTPEDWVAVFPPENENERKGR